MAILTGAAVSGGLGLALIVGRDGSAPWRLARVATVAAITALVVAGLRSTHARSHAALAFVAGLALLPVGIGIGLRHLSATGLTVVAFAGLLALGGGLVLVFTGGVTLVRRAGPWRGAILALALVLALLALCLPLAEAVAATNVPPTGVGASTPADRGLEYRDAVFTTSDGARLSGWYIPSRNGAAVAVLHGAGSTRSAVLDHAVVLARHGFGVLLFDARGHGRSTGRAMDFGWYGDADIAAALSYLEAQRDVSAARMAVVGMSMGGEEAIGALASDARIRAVVAEGATNRVSGDKAWLSDAYGWRGALQEGIDRLTYGAADLLTATTPPVTLRAAVAAVPAQPVLLIAGGAVTDEAKAGRYIQSASPGTVQLWVVPRAGHTQGLASDGAEWEYRVVSFLDAALTRPGP
jgi:uncharacterized protein